MVRRIAHGASLTSEPCALVIGPESPAGRIRAGHGQSPKSTSCGELTPHGWSHVFGTLDVGPTGHGPSFVSFRRPSSSSNTSDATSTNSLTSSKTSGFSGGGSPKRNSDKHMKSWARGTGSAMASFVSSRCADSTDARPNLCNGIPFRDDCRSTRPRPCDVPQRSLLESAQCCDTPGGQIGTSVEEIPPRAGTFNEQQNVD